MKRTLILALALSVSTCGLAAAQQPAPTATIDHDVRAIMDAHGVKGMSVLVLRDDAPVLQRSYGTRDGKLPVDNQTMFEIGSNTKHFTAAAVMQLVEQHKIDLHATLATYLPSAPHANEVTITQLLSHTSGIPEYLQEATAYAEGAKRHTPQDIIASIAKHPLDFTPGTKWAYSNTNYILLGMVIEKVSGVPYEQYMRQHVFDAAGVPEAATIATESALKDRALGYAEGKPAHALDDSYAWSAGNLVLNTMQFARLDTALEHGKIVSPTSWTAMTTPETPKDASVQYGYGWLIDSHDAQPRIWHNGGTFGFSSADHYYPQQHVRIIVLANDENGFADETATKVFDDLYPEIAAAAARPVAGEDTAQTARFKTVLTSLLAGSVDRAQFDASMNAHLTDAYVAQIKSQSDQLGSLQNLTYRGMNTTAGQNRYTYLISFSKAGSFKLSVVTDTQNKIAQFLLAPP